MSQGKLEVVKQEMTRMNIDILGIRELRWTGRGEFNSDDHYIYYCGQESLRRNGVAIMVNKRIWHAIRGCNLKNDRMISVRFQGKPFNITVIQVYAPTSNAEEAEGARKRDTPGRGPGRQQTASGLRRTDRRRGPYQKTYQNPSVMKASPMTVMFLNHKLLYYQCWKRSPYELDHSL